MLNLLGIRLDDNAPRGDQGARNFGGCGPSANSAGNEHDGSQADHDMPPDRRTRVN
jgi:hypothetical protein